MTRTTVRFLLLCLLIVTVVSCVGVGNRGKREQALTAELAVLPLSEENITLVADLGSDRRIKVHSVTLTSLHLIVEDVDGKLFALDRKSMRPAWHYYGLDRTMDFALSEGAGSYLIVTANKLYQIAKVTGAEMGVHHLPFTPSSGPSGNDSTAYIGSYASAGGNKTLYSVNLADGRVGWGYRTGGHITGQPLVGGAPRQLVYFASHDMRVYALETASAFEDAPSAAWMNQTHGRNSADITLSGKLLLVPSEEGCLYAYDRATGTKAWEFISGRPLKMAADGTKNAVYFQNEYGFHCLDRMGGEKWRNQLGPTKLLLERGGQTWLKVDDDAVAIVDSANGEVDFLNDDFDGWFLPTNDMDGTFYAVSPDGFCFAYTERLKLR